MVQKPERGRYLTLEDVRVSYKPKDDTIHLTSSDPDIPNGSFHMTLNKGTPTEEAVREVLLENGLIRPEQPAAAVTPSDIVWHSSPAPDAVEEMLCGNGRNIFVSGSPGSGKGVITSQVAYYASLMGLPAVLLRSPHHDESRERNVTDENVKPLRFSELPDGFLNPFSLSENPKTQKQFSVSIVGELLGGMHELDTEETMVLDRAIEAVLTRKNPSLGRLVDFLRDNPREVAARGLGYRLDSIRSLPYAETMFAQASKDLPLFSFWEFPSIIMDGLLLPDEATPEAEYSYSNRFAVMAQLLLLNKIMNEDLHFPRLLIVDNYLPNKGTTDNLIISSESLKQKQASGLSTIFVSHAREKQETDREFLFQQGFPAEQLVPEQAELETGAFIHKLHDGNLRHIRPILITPHLEEFRTQLSF